MSNDIALFGGEFVVKEDGIYTYAHHYEHPETKRRVILVGTNHGGDKEYFEAIAKIIEGAGVVLYEGVPPSREEIARGVPEEVDDDLKSFSEENIDEAFYAALATYFHRTDAYLQLVDEKDAFDYFQPGWESGDAEFFAQYQSEEELERFWLEYQKSFARLTSERKKEIVGFVLDAISSMKEGRFTKKDLGDGFVFFWSDQTLVDLMLEVLGKPRDEIVMERLDKVVTEQNPPVVGIKFGAGHIAYQRQLLEQRGYVWQYSVELRNLAF